MAESSRWWLATWRQVRRRRRTTAAPRAEEVLAGLDASLGPLSLAPEPPDGGRSLVRTLDRLAARRVPLRRIRPAPVDGVVRLVFADGTVLLVRATGRADALATALVARRRAVRLLSHRLDEPERTAVLTWAEGRLEVRVVGGDQPD